MTISRKILIGCLLLVANIAMAEVIVPIKLTSTGLAIGTVIINDTPDGLEFTPRLRNLPPGLHGFHVHVANSCDNQGGGAGGHLDPQKTGKHLGPFSQYGHLGDLPVLQVAKDGTATISVYAPRLREADVVQHSLMIHEGGDNYSDQPQKSGGGGKRIACGVIPNHPTSSLATDHK